MRQKRRKTCLELGRQVALYPGRPLALGSCLLASDNHVFNSFPMYKLIWSHVLAHLGRYYSINFALVPDVRRTCTWAIWCQHERGIITIVVSNSEQKYKCKFIYSINWVKRNLWLSIPVINSGQYIEIWNQPSVFCIVQTGGFIPKINRMAWLWLQCVFGRSTKSCKCIFMNPSYCLDLVFGNSLLAVDLPA